jgi:uncharacterized protein (DUF983 family)
MLKGAFLAVEKKLMSSIPHQPGPRNEDPGSPTRPRSLLAAMLLQRCPRCRQGRLFRAAFAMNDPCPVCGLVLEREPGYFFGAMYFSYGLSILFLAPLFFFFQWLLPDWPGPLVVLLTIPPYLPLVPIVFRYSRVLWIYFDRAASPSELSTHAGWLRHREAERRDRDSDPA